MSRILDVVGAFESRGYPEVTGSATFTVDDPLFPENDGTFVLEAEDGKVHVARGSNGGASAAIPIGGLSTLFAGYRSPAPAGVGGGRRFNRPRGDVLGRGHREAVGGPLGRQRGRGVPGPGHLARPDVRPGLRDVRRSSLRRALQAPGSEVERLGGRTDQLRYE